MTPFVLDSVCDHRLYRAFAHIATDGSEGASPHVLVDVAFRLTRNEKWGIRSCTPISVKHTPWGDFCAILNVDGIRVRVVHDSSRGFANVYHEENHNRLMHVACDKTVLLPWGDAFCKLSALFEQIRQCWTSAWPVKEASGDWSIGGVTVAVRDEAVAQRCAVRYVSDLLLAEAIVNVCWIVRSEARGVVGAEGRVRREVVEQANTVP